MNLKVKDLMTTGMYSALYFVHVCVGTAIGFFVMHSGNMLLVPAIIGLISGTIYLLLVNKVRKFGAITLLGLVMATFFFLSGYFILSFIPSLICGVLADSVSKLGGYQKRLTNILSYIVFSFGNFGPIFLMWFAKDDYIKRLVEKGKDQTYIANVMVDFDMVHVMVLVICCVVGGLFGEYMLNKHFKKAGLIT